MLEGLAYSNLHIPAPKPIDPALFFDLVKIRRLVEEATNLAVRAANATTASSLGVLNSAGNGIFNASGAEVLGLGGLRGGVTAKLSKERRYRMHEHATQKLSHAYHLDEIASSVAMMQSASALEDVARLVLQRDASSPDAQYVHFFHEKIPSRQMAECTSLRALDAVVYQQPTDASPLRTRAVTRMFKNDYVGAARDLTEALAVRRMYSVQHRKEQRDLIHVRDAANLVYQSRNEAKVEEKDQPSSLESQLLFHRAGTYLTLACNHVGRALRRQKEVSNVVNSNHSLDHLPPTEEQKARAEARKTVRTYAKRALRDLIAFLSHFEYTPGIAVQHSDSVVCRVKALNDHLDCLSGRARAGKLLDVKNQICTAICGSSAITKCEAQQSRRGPYREDSGYTEEANGHIPEPTVYRINQLFMPVPPPNLTSFRRNHSPHDHSNGILSDGANLPFAECTEAATYHPLLADALHSLLLAHALVQTPPKEHLRHAYMVARLVRIMDGYPVFHAARSPARADWIEVLRRTKNWLGVQGKWEDLCNPPPPPAQTKASQKLLKAGDRKETKVAETAEQRRIRRSQDAVLDALADERVVDEETFRASVRARELRAAREEEEEQRKEYLRTTTSTNEVAGSPTAGSLVNGHAESNGASSNGETASQTQRAPAGNTKKDEVFSITTERAEAIARWILEAPPSSSAGETGTRDKPRMRRKGGSKNSKVDGPVLHVPKTESEATLSKDIDGASEAGMNELERSLGNTGLMDVKVLKLNNILDTISRSVDWAG